MTSVSMTAWSEEPIGALGFQIHARARWRCKRINVERMQMDEIEKEAIEVSMNYGSSTAVPVSQKAPEFSEIRFAHIRGNHAAVGVSLCGLPESPLRKLTMEDVVIDARDPLREEYVEK